MPIGINNATTVTLQNITDIANVTDMPQLFLKINHFVFDGWYWFIMLWVLWYILFVAANQVTDQPLNNAMYSGLIVSILSFLLRGIRVVENGVLMSLLTDHQLWVFPVITAVLAAIIWSIKD